MGGGSRWTCHLRYLSSHNCGEVLLVPGHLPQGWECKQVEGHQTGHWVACSMNTCTQETAMEHVLSTTTAQPLLYT